VVPSTAMRDKAVSITKDVEGVKEVNTRALKVGS
jgi:osmotically-inducible protein OsmY